MFAKALEYIQCVAEGTFNHKASLSVSVFHAKVHTRQKTEQPEKQLFVPADTV